VSNIATIVRDTCIAWSTSAGLKRTREDSGIATGPSGTKSSVDAGAASGLSKKSRRECREDEEGGTDPKSKTKAKADSRGRRRRERKWTSGYCTYFANEKDTL
jgi:hypothetical protein